MEQGCKVTIVMDAILTWCEEYLRAAERPDYARIVRQIGGVRP